MFRFDAHAHSVISDGTESPGDAVRAAARANIDIIALTDHDTFSGLDEAARVADEVGIGFVPGVELSTRVHGIAVHLLAYFPDPSDQELDDLVTKIRDARLTRIREMADRIGEDYRGVSWDALQLEGDLSRPWGRPHLADLLISLGYFPTRESAFETVLHPKSPYYVRQWSPAPEDMVSAVRRAGGVPVVAHPLSSRRGALSEAALKRMVEAGLFGLERDHREHSAAARRQIDEWASRWGLAVTGGSDYHGAGKPNHLGENITAPEVLVAMKKEARR